MDISSAGITEHLHKLCSALSSNPDGAFEFAISYLSTKGEQGVPNEKLLCQKIHDRLVSVSVRDADKFNECYQKVKSSLVLKQRASVLALLLALSETSKTGATQQLFPIPNLSNVKSNMLMSTATSNTSKSTIGSMGWCSTAPKAQASNQSLPSDHSGMAVVVQDRPSERSCVREAVLAATGVRTHSNIALSSRPMQVLYSRIAHLGFLHDRLKEFIDPTSGLMPQGLMGEGLVASIRDELTEYHRSVAMLQSQTYEEDGGGATLRRVCVWAQEPLHRMTWLANMAHTAHHKKGGELASCIHRFVRHGDDRVATLARRLLTELTYPLLLMLTRWLLHGEIDDPFNEFFIESRSNVPIDRMWHDKYRVREWMVPSFMSRELAAQILATGKSVVFMREACADHNESSDHAHHLEALLKPSADGAAGAAWWEASELGEAVAAAHEAASQRLLAALAQHHHLLDHLVAHRRYLLLAQGDFVHHLMTLMQEELNKPATSLYVHNLSCTLEAAVRATNAQYEPAHVLQRLHVNLYPNCDGRGLEESGWEVFALQYRVDGPLGTLFPATCAASYRALFTQLWRVKRIEHALHHAWREHILLQKRLKYMPEVWGLMRRVSCLQRHCIDNMIHASTQELQSYLGNVLGETLALRNFEERLHMDINTELERRDKIEAIKAERVAEGRHPITSADEAHDKEKRKIFLQILANRKADLNVWARTYRGHVTTLILKLALHTEVSLQTLAFRLDYSDFYKRGDSKLHEPLTYQHKRLSEIGLSLAKTKLIDRTRKK